MIFRINKNRKDIVQPDPNIYEWYPVPFRSEHKSDDFDSFFLMPQDGHWCHSPSEAFSKILCDIFLQLFNSMDVVKELELFEYFQPKQHYRSKRETLLHQYSRWRNNPEHFFIKEDIQEPKQKNGISSRTTTLTLSSKGVDLSLLNEYFYQLQNEFFVLDNFSLHIYGAELTDGTTNLQGEARIKEIKAMKSLHLFLDDAHPALTLQVRKSSAAENLMDICREIVEKHSGTFQPHFD